MWSQKVRYLNQTFFRFASTEIEVVSDGLKAASADTIPLSDAEYGEILLLDVFDEIASSEVALDEGKHLMTLYSLPVERTWRLHRTLLSQNAIRAQCVFTCSPSTRAQHIPTNHQFHWMHRIACTLLVFRNKLWGKNAQTDKKAIFMHLVAVCFVYYRTHGTTTTTCTFHPTLHPQWA